MIFDIQHYQTLGEKAYTYRKAGEKEMARHATRQYKRCIKHETTHSDRELATDAFNEGFRIARLS